jgi:unsaturated rhamnogalacturonyl hydrolase
MATPFVAQYAEHFHEPALFSDVAKQIILIDRHAYDRTTGLYWHGWDEARTQSWANRGTGDSANFWSRSIGWYAMAIVDSSDYLPADLPEMAKIQEVFRRLAAGVVQWQDPATGTWWQITNFGGRKGNYLEASGSAMFVYALAKGVNKGFLPRGKYLPVISKAYAGIIGSFVRTDRDGQVGLMQICRSAGLGNTMSDGRARDGSYDYYISEPIVENDPKGTGPFILAGIEVQKLLTQRAALP